MMPVRRNQNWLPSIFNDFFDNDWMVKANATAPAINVFETAKEYKVELAAPGMTKEDFNVHIDEENNLVISMEKKTESKEENNKDEKKEGRYLRREFSYTKFQQTMILPDDVDKEKIGAHVENGVLNITLPKFTEAEKEKAKKFIDVKYLPLHKIMQREIFYIHSYAELFLFPFQKTVCQPPAHRFIIEFQTSISKDNGSHESKYHIRDTFHHCSVIVAYPSRISIYQWIMGNINRIGNVSQELAYGSRALTGHLAARSH